MVRKINILAVMKQLFVILAVIVLPLMAAAQDIAEFSSPGGKISCKVKYLDGDLTAAITLCAIDYETIDMRLGLKTSAGTLGTSKDVFVKNTSSKYDGVIESNIAEKASIPDSYCETTMYFNYANNVDFEVVMRLYDEGVAVRYNVSSGSSIGIYSDLTSIDLSAYSPSCYQESKTESGYTLKGPSSSGTSIAPLFIHSDRLCVLMNEAANLALADPLQIEFKKSKYTFSQSYYAGEYIGTSWRYCVFAGNPVEMIDGKYIITSLNNQNTDNTDWIKPGKTFRVCIPGNTFPTDSIKNRIDFAQKMNFKYVLLDAGWYGLGYSKEHNTKSDPREPVAGLDIEEVCRYGEERGIGIIVYVNRVAWENYNNTEMLNLYQKWGIKGLKLGFMDGKARSGLSKIYSIIKGAYDRKMIVNVHDEIRQTGLERQFPNLMTTEGIRGNEHRENEGDHTTLLPFSRFMTGSGDYTVCYKGYPSNNAAYKNMNTTKGHQLALATAFFCPIQHIFWYGKPYEYPNETEIEYFKELPTVWDDYKVLEGEPTEYFTIARKSGKRWFLSTHTYLPREVNLDLSFLDGEKSYNAVLYTDDASESINKDVVTNLKSDGTLSFRLLRNGGAVAIISESDPEPEIIVEVDPEPNPDPDPEPNPEPDPEPNPEPDDNPDDNPNESDDNNSGTETADTDDDSNTGSQSQDSDDDNPKTVVETPSGSKVSVNALKIYPNPADDLITIENAAGHIMIFDINGKKVKDLRLSDGNNEIDISGLKSGMYFITDGAKTTKIVKK